MSYSPFITDKSHKLVKLEDLNPEAKGMTVLVRRFDEGHYQRWQALISEIPEGDVEDEKKRKTSTRDALLEIGIMAWNFKDAEGKPTDLTKKAILLLDNTVSSWIRDQIYLHNPIFWPYMSAIDIERLGLQGKVKNA